MYEQIPAPSVEVSDTPDDTPDILGRSTRTVEEVVHDIPELAERQENITESLQKFMVSQEVDVKFLDDKLAGLVLCGVLDRLNQTPEDDQGARDFLNSSLVVLAQTHSPKLKRAYEEVSETGPSKDETEKMRAYDRYTNREMTQQLQQAIDDGLLDSVKARLEIDTDTEDPYELHVMNVTSEHGSLYSFRSEFIEWNDKLDYAENMIVMKQMDEDAHDIDQWKRQLKRNSDEFLKLTGETTIASAWVETVHGKTVVAIPLPVAEKILDGEEGLHSLYDADDYSRDMAILEHEYTHTQNIHMPEGSYAVGSLLEELRAEHFSGNKNGYIDLKLFARDFGVMTGKDLVEYLQPKQSKYDTYAALANDIGVERMVELSLARSRAYTEHEVNQYNHTIDAYIGGMNGMSIRILEDVYAADDENRHAVERRAGARIDKHLREMTIEDLTDTLEYRESSYGMHTMTRLYEKMLEEKKTAEPVSL